MATSSAPPVSPTTAAPATPRRHRRLRWFVIGGIVVATAIVAAFIGYPTARLAVLTVSTDDAYVNSHVTFVAPRVAGQALAVPVEDNNRVSKGDLLVKLDPAPYEVQLRVREAAAATARAELAAATAQVRASEALARSQRWKLETAVQQVDSQVALLRARTAALRADQATLARTQADVQRAERLGGAVSTEELGQRRQAAEVAAATVRQGLEEANQVRVGLGLSPVEARWDRLGEWKEGDWDKLTVVPADLNQTYSGVRQALAELTQTVATFTTRFQLPTSEETPAQVIKRFREQDPTGDVDRVLRSLVPEAPAVLQAQAKVAQADRDVEQAKLNLSYTEVRAEIDGVVTRRNVNPGNYLQPGQQVMAVRSLTEVWIDCNFKETQLADLRIGQRVEVYADMYGSARVFRGRVSGFTAGTGSTLALLPAQNATGNFVKVVQRLPVRVDFTEPLPADAPLFPGLSVTPYVFVKEPATGPAAGGFLQ